MLDAQEMRRRWTDKTEAVFSPQDRHDYREYAAEGYEREFDFRGCKNIMFFTGERIGGDIDVLLLTQGSGHMTVPAGVQVMVQSGYAKCEPAASAGGASSSVVGPGIRAPPPSRVSGYARSYADSVYSGAGRASGRSGGGPGSVYTSARSVAPEDSISSVGSRRDAGAYYPSRSSYEDYY
ncbi:hypothetical protein VTK56DRAFT_10033 [Thermocarpiscus australiensis]